jgi:hypothetical protein
MIRDSDMGRSSRGVPSSLVTGGDERCKEAQVHRMNAWALPHLTESPVSALYNQCKIATGRFSWCQASLSTGALRILPLDETTIAIEGVSSQGTRRFLISVTPTSWKLSSDTLASRFHHKLGEGDAALAHISQAIQNAYGTGKTEKIAQHFVATVRDELHPKPVVVRGAVVNAQGKEIDILAAWATVDSILESPTSTKHLERPIPNNEGKVTHHLLITFQGPKKRFILEMLPFPRPFDSRPPESITITRDTISHFNPDGSEPFSSKERAIEVFYEWIARWEDR